ncbi:hypothetical protein HZH66_012729 [Vespula vulgaris]|uniref:Uncharacterized protein n=1 Tax=Vespula vulgaris TaxID=7454 RepID=A0A834J7R9_VESVU|nr:hypothetical protein HZH66_012729 [Vespula vulgaris]
MSHIWIVYTERSELRFDFHVGGYTYLESCYLVYEKKKFTKRIKIVILLFERRLEVDMPIASTLRDTTSLGFGAKDQPEVNDHRNIHVRPAADGRAWPHREEENRSLDYRESVRIGLRPRKG